MKLYLVRHGQTDYNKETRHQNPTIMLSEQGKRQAEFVGKRFESIPIDIIISSPYARAHHTAKEIQKTTNKQLILSDLFTERKNPSIYADKLHSDPELQPIKKLIKENSHDPNWHYSDEENFHDFVIRTDKALEFILAQKKENIVAVTHGFFLSALTCRIIFGDLLTAPLFESFRKHTQYSNTGISVFEYTDEKWIALTWNDYAHLGE